MDEWRLVRLSQPLVDPYPDASYPLKTGQRALDVAIQRLRIHRIELALTNAACSPHDPSATARLGSTSWCFPNRLSRLGIGRKSVMRNRLCCIGGH
jgi:hypothetical protein